MRASLEFAARRWPEDRDRPTALLLRLIEAGTDAARAQEEQRRAARIVAIRRGGVGLEGAYPPNYLEDLRRDWPE